MLNGLFSNSIWNVGRDFMSDIKNILNFYEKSKDSYFRTQPEFISRQIYLRKTNHYRIRFCFIPTSQNFKNVRSYLEHKTGSFKKWQEIRDHYFELFDYKCSCCKREFLKSELELHEHWEFSSYLEIQFLTALLPLCKECHSIAHINRFEKQPEEIAKLMSLYKKYNNVDDKTAWHDFELQDTFKKDKANTNYKLDMSFLSDFDIKEKYFNCHSDDFNSFLYYFTKDSE